MTFELLFFQLTTSLGLHGSGQISIVRPQSREDKVFYATETYITHFLEDAQFPKASVLAGRKVLYAP